MSEPGMPIGLLQQEASKNIDPAQLDSMGKRAAALYSESGKSLNNSVVEVVKEAQLSPEQVKRVCEFANTAAYLNDFEKSGEVRNVTFEDGPANPGYVLKELNDGSAPAVHQIKEAHYESPVGHYKTAGVAGDHLLAEMFGTAGMSKEASVDQTSRASGAEEAYDLQVRLEGTKEHFISKLAGSGVLFDDVRRDLCEATRQQVSEGSSLAEIGVAWSSYTPSSEMLKEAMELVTDHIRTSGDLNQDEINGSMTKSASSKVPNPNHPVVERFIAFTKTAAEHRKLGRAVEVLNEQIKEAKTAVRGML